MLPSAYALLSIPNPCFHTTTLPFCLVSYLSFHSYFLIPEEITLQHLHDLEHLISRTGLLDPKPATSRIKAAVHHLMGNVGDDIATGRTMVVNARAVRMGDVVFYMEGGVYMRDSCRAGMVLFHTQIQDKVFCCISDWEVLQWDAGFARCRVAESPRMVCAEHVLESAIFFGAATGAIAQVLIPARWRAS